jgi:GT2 family glycosyltransferase
VIVPTRSSWTAIGATVHAVLEAGGTGVEVVVAGDQTAPAEVPRLDPHVRVAVNRGARGFAPTCNAGARAARGELLLFLNDDVVLGAGVLDALAGALARPGVGGAGPDVRSRALGRSESGTALAWRHGVLEARQEALAGGDPVEVPYLCGAALAVRRADFERLGGFDERLAPYYWEDVDLSLRLREAIGPTVAVAAAVDHRHGATIGRESERLRRVVYERNRFLVSWRHLRGARWIVHLAWLPLRLAASLLRDRAVVAGLLAALRAAPAAGRAGARRD